MLELSEDLILPVQFYGRRQRLDHQDIELAVLVQAIMDRFYDGPPLDDDHDPEAERREAIEWLASDNPEQFGFRSCCDDNGIDPDWLRAKLATLNNFELPVESPIDLLTERPTVLELIGLRKVPVCPHHPTTAATVYVTRKRSGFSLRCLECARERCRARAAEIRLGRSAAQVQLFS